MINFEALFKISYGLYIVSAGDDKKKSGFISNTVFQVTSEPARFAACCNKDNFTAEYIKQFEAFSVSVLKQDADAQLFSTFGYRSGKTTDKFEGIRTQTGETGTPIVLNDTIAFIECKLVQTFDVGTHYIFIGELLQAEVLEETSDPLTYAYYRKVKKGLAPKNAPTYIDKSKLEQKVETSPGKKYRCPTCGYIYDPAKGDAKAGIKPGTPFEDLPDTWVCPLCGTEKSDFVELK